MQRRKINKNSFHGNQQLHLTKYNFIKQILKKNNK